MSTAPLQDRLLWRSPPRTIKGRPGTLDPRKELDAAHPILRLQSVCLAAGRWRLCRWLGRFARRLWRRSGGEGGHFRVVDDRLLRSCNPSWGRQDFFDFFFKSCGGQKKGKILKKAVGAPAKVCLGQNLDFVRRSVIPKSLKIEYMKGNFAKLGFIRQNFAKISKIYQNFAKKMAKFPDKSTLARHC